MDISQSKSGTAAVWAGELQDFFMGATTPPIVNSVTFGYHDLDEWSDVALGKKEGYIYSRNTNPTIAVFEEKVRVLEKAEAAISFSTGMAAISNTLFALLEPGDRVVSIKDTYGGTSRIFLEFLPKFKVEVTMCETGDHEQMEGEISKEELHDLEDDFQGEYGEYLEEILQDVHDEICPDTEVLYPIAYIAKSYAVKGDEYKVELTDGVYVEVDKYPGKETKLALIPNPIRVLLNVGKEKQEVVWTAK